MGLTAKTDRTSCTTLLMIWVVVGFVLDGLQANPVRDHSSISQGSEVQHILNHRKMTRRETSVLNDDSIKTPSHNIREDIRPDPGPLVSSKSLSSLSSSHKGLAPSQQLRSALLARSTLLPSQADASKRRHQLPKEQNNIHIKTSKNQEASSTTTAKTTISTSHDIMNDDFQLYPLDAFDYYYYYNLDDEVLSLTDKSTTNINKQTSKSSAAVTTPAPSEHTQRTSSKSTSTVSLSTSNTAVGTTESSITTTSTTSEPITQASTDTPSEVSILSTQRSVTSSIHVTSPEVSTVSFKTTAITPRSFRYTTLKPSLKQEPSVLLLNRIRDLSLSSGRPITEASHLLENTEKAQNKAKTFKRDQITEPLQIHLLSDSLVVEINNGPKITSQSQRQSRAHSPRNPPSQAVSRVAASTSTSSIGGSTSSNTTTPKPSTTTIPVSTTSTGSSTTLVPDNISEKNVEAQLKSQSHSVSTSAVRFEVHTTAESSPTEIFEKLPPTTSNNTTPSPALQLIRQIGETPLGLTPFGENPIGSMPFGLHPQGQHPFGLHPLGLSRKANVTNGATTTTNQTTTTLPTVQATTENISSVINETTTTSKPDIFPTFDKATQNEKVGYVVAEENQSRFQLEQVTKDGFLIGEFGVVNHSNGDVNGVRYTADGSVDHKLIHEALQRFLRL